MGLLWDVYNFVDHKDFSDHKKYSSKIILPELSDMNMTGYGENKKQNITEKGVTNR
nr:hypothetical protein [uncultured Blautia sp.]